MKDWSVDLVARRAKIAGRFVSGGISTGTQNISAIAARLGGLPNGYQHEQMANQARFVASGPIQRSERRTRDFRASMDSMDNSRGFWGI